MAGIDKIFVTSWNQFCELRDWLGSRGYLKDDYGNYFRPSDFISDYLREEDFDGSEIAVMNNPIYFDIWLIRNCPIDWVQSILKSQYPKYYEGILERTSIFDTYKRSGLGRKIKIKLPKHCSNVHSIMVKFPGPGFARYDKSRDRWTHVLELKGSTDSCGIPRLKNHNRRSIYRKLKSWNLPENTIIRLFKQDGGYSDHVIKKL